MVIIVDAYNYIKQVVQVSFAHERTIQDIVRQFIEYANLRKNEIILVFDAGPYQRVTYEQVHPSVQIWYSGEYASADDVIKDLVDEKKAQDILIVTSDREICAYATLHNIVSIGSPEFAYVFSRVVQASQKVDQKIKGTLIKTSVNQNEKLDAWMEMASRSLVQKDKQYEINTEIILQSLYSTHKISKTDKRLLKKLSKI